MGARTQLFVTGTLPVGSLGTLGRKGTFLGSLVVQSMP